MWQPYLKGQVEEEGSVAGVGRVVPDDARGVVGEDEGGVLALCLQVGGVVAPEVIARFASSN